LLDVVPKKKEKIKCQRRKARKTNTKDTQENPRESASKKPVIRELLHGDWLDGSGSACPPFHPFQYKNCTVKNQNILISFLIKIVLQ